MVQVHRNEGVAIHIGPESCAGGREAVREALTGERAGQPWNRENDASRVPTFFLCAEGNMSRRDSARAGSTRRGLRPWHADWPEWRATAGPHREGEEPKPMMNDPEESDPAVVAMNLANKVGPPIAEQGEPRAGTKGKAEQHSTCRAQDRESVSQVLDRIRQAARHRTK